MKNFNKENERIKIKKTNCFPMIKVYPVFAKTTLSSYNTRAAIGTLILNTNYSLPIDLTVKQRKRNLRMEIYVTLNSSQKYNLDNYT